MPAEGRREVWCFYQDWSAKPLKWWLILILDWHWLVSRSQCNYTPSPTMTTPILWIPKMNRSSTQVCIRIIFPFAGEIVIHVVRINNFTPNQYIGVSENRLYHIPIMAVGQRKCWFINGFTATLFPDKPKLCVHMEVSEVIWVPQKHPKLDHNWVLKSMVTQGVPTFFRNPSRRKYDII